MARSRFLIVGTGARRHALARRLSAEGSEVWLAPGTPAIAEFPVQVAPVAMEAVQPLAGWAASQRIDTALILNEALLFGGMADVFVRAGVGCLGAGQAPALIERSKIFAHVAMQALGIPSPPVARIRHGHRRGRRQPAVHIPGRHQSRRAGDGHGRAHRRQRW